MEIKVRPAKTSDIETLLAFEKGIIEAERPFDETLKPGEIHYYDLIELINSPNAEVVVAYAGNEIIGSGYAKIRQAKPYIKFQEYVYLGFMFVKREFRGRGINQLLINYLIEWTKKKGLTEIKLDVYAENESALKAYSKIGFKPYMLKMRLDVGNNS